MAKKKIAKRKATKKKVGKKKARTRPVRRGAAKPSTYLWRFLFGARGDTTGRPGADVKIARPVGEQAWARLPCVELLALLFLIRSVVFTRHQDLAHERGADDTPNPVGLFPLCNSSMTQPDRKQ